MLKRFCISGYENRQIREVSCNLEPYSIFIISRDFSEEWSHSEGFEEGILRYNHLTNQKSYFSFEKGVKIISFLSNQGILYYAYLNWNGNKAIYKIYSLDCIDFKSKEVYSFIVDDVSTDQENSNLWETQIFGLSDRFLIVCIPNTNSRRKPSIYNETLLIDIKENKSYSLSLWNGTINFLDLISIKVFELKKQFFIRIHTGKQDKIDKEKTWGNNNHTAYIDASESLVLVSLDKFIQSVKNSIPVVETAVFENFDRNSSYFCNGLLGSQFYWQIIDFANQSSKVAMYDLETSNYNEMHLSNVFNYIFDDGRYIYGVEESKTENSLYNLTQNKKIFSINTTEQIYFGTNNLVISNYFEGLEEYVKFIGFNNNKIIEEKVFKIRAISINISHDSIVFVK